jgi:hypothetical protein
MVKRLVSLALCCVVLLFDCASSPALANSVDKHSRFARNVKSKLERLGTGDATRIDVRLFDGQVVSGSVGEISENSFTVLDSHTGEALTVQFGNVSQVKGHNLNTGVKIALTFLACMAIAVLVVGIALSTDR